MKVKVVERKVKRGISLILEIYWGYQKDVDGKVRHNREFKKLDLYLIENPRTSDERKRNKQMRTLAESIRAKKEVEIQSGKYGFRNPNQKKIKLFDYFYKLMEERKENKGNYGNWESCLKHLKSYCHESTLLTDVDVDFIEGFKKHLLTQKLTKSDKVLAINSASSYFNKLRSCINQAYNDDLILKNPVKKVKSIKGEETQREYLTEDEIKLLAKTDCRYEVLKRAFLFSCYTGLRWSDVNKLTWDELKKENEGYKIIFKQKKTKGQEYLHINDTARKLMGDRREASERVFKGLRYNTQWNLALDQWALKAGVKKHITFHTARHSNATWLLNKGVDLYVVMKILGHKDIRTTQVYAKIVGERLKEAMDRLPNLEIYLDD